LSGAVKKPFQRPLAFSGKKPAGPGNADHFDCVLVSEAVGFTQPERWTAEGDSI
jgi:hypothetical protein